MQRRVFFKVFAVYFLVSILVLLSNFLSYGSIGTLAIVPGLLSVFLLVPLWIWYRRYFRKTSLSSEIEDHRARAVVSWVLFLFFLALVVRIPSVLFFGMAYEKTPLIYLVVLSAVALMRCDVSVFGFKTDNFWRSLLLGCVYFVLFGLLPYILIGVGFYSLEGQTLVEGFDPLPFLFTLPFMTLCVGISEEGLFRGYMQTRFTEVYDRRKAIFFQALLFGLWHFIWHISPLDWFGMLGHIGSTFMVGLLFGYFFGIAGNLTPLVLAHGLIDSVPEGFIENQSAFAYVLNLPLSTQLLLFLIPYVVSWILTFAMTKILIKAFTRR